MSVVVFDRAYAALRATPENFSAIGKHVHSDVALSFHRNTQLRLFESAVLTINVTQIRDFEILTSDFMCQVAESLQQLSGSETAFFTVTFKTISKVDLFQPPDSECQTAFEARMNGLATGGRPRGLRPCNAWDCGSITYLQLKPTVAVHKHETNGKTQFTVYPCLNQNIKNTV